MNYKETRYCVQEEKNLGGYLKWINITPEWSVLSFAKNFFERMKKSNENLRLIKLEINISEIKC